MDDKQLNATLEAFAEARQQFHREPVESRKEAVLSAEARAAIKLLQAEAKRVPDPGGPLDNYGDALDSWASANHPDIAPMIMVLFVTSDLMVAHR